MIIPESSVDVILIERSFAPLYKGVTDTGCNRRCLRNHNEIKTKLEKKYGDRFRNVILEEMAIEEQIALFKHAKIVIGQHGAGLCNIVWMTRKHATVIEFPPFQSPTFSNMANALGIRHKRMDHRRFTGIF